MSAHPNSTAEPGDEREIQQRLHDGYAATPDPRFVRSLDKRLQAEYTASQPTQSVPARAPGGLQPVLALGLAVAVVLLIMLTVGLAGFGIWRLANSRPAPASDPAHVAESAIRPEARIAEETPVEPPEPTSPAVSDTQTITVSDGPLQPSPRTTEGVPGAAKAVEKEMAGGQKLRYGWQEGKRYTYQYKVEAKIDDTSIGANGYVTYLPAKPTTSPAAPEVRTATGTGFLVNADGHLITCAHVVKGATRVEVTLGTRKLVGRVVSLDSRHDLALVKIAANALPSVSLGNSAAVELAQDVRVVGFPLTDQLGSSVKVTRGTVAGILDRQGSTLFQIDAAINAGNSGGPLINEQGQVVGVANAKLCGDEISNVGFAIPAAQVLEFLRKNNVGFANGGRADTLAGPELAKRVTPAVVLLHVTLGAGGVGDQPALLLHYAADIHHNKPPAQSSRTRFGPFGGPMFSPFSSGGSYWQNERGKLQVDLGGELLDGSPEQNLPFLLGPTALLALEPLGLEGEKTWSQQRGLSLITKEKQQQTDSFPFGPRMPRPRFPGNPFEAPDPPKEKIKAVLSAIERQDFELSELTADSATILKRYELETLDRQSPTKLQVKGNGRMVFDRRAGVISEMSFDFTYEVCTDNVTVRLPVSYSYSWQKDDGAGHEIPANVPSWSGPGTVKITAETELKPKQLVFCGFHNQWPMVQVDELLEDGRVKVTFLGWDAVWKATVPRSRLSMAIPKAAKTEPEPVAAEQVDTWLKQLGDTNAFTVSKALGQLAKADPNDRREDVVRAITPLVNQSKEWMVREAAVQALAKWGTEESLPTLIEATRDTHHGTRRQAIAALGNFRHNDAAEALVLIFPSNQHDVRAALEKLGDIAEGPVATLLEHKEWNVQYQACQVLQRIGTAKSLPALRSTAEKTKLLTKKAAEEAIAAIEAREKKVP